MPEIKFGEKEDGPPRWTTWLESWYATYDPLVWRVLKCDDDEDEGGSEEAIASWQDSMLPCYLVGCSAESGSIVRLLLPLLSFVVL